jgi:hypothetical protein
VVVDGVVGVVVDVVVDVVVGGDHDQTRVM